MSSQSLKITEDTFLEFGFNLTFNPGTWTVSFGDNLTEMTPALTKTILLGICELIVGCVVTGHELSDFDTIELPSAFGCRGGMADFEVTSNKKLVNVTGYLTAGFDDLIKN